jgi:hypothetical protein
MNTNGTEAVSFFYAGQRKCARIRRFLQAFNERIPFVNLYPAKVYEVRLAAFKIFCAVNIRYDFV